MKTLFKGGTIYDGTGARPYVGDVLIEDDRIVKVGKHLLIVGGNCPKLVLELLFNAHGSFVGLYLGLE